MAYLDGELSSAEVSRLKEHLAACPACDRELNEQRRLIDAIKALPRVPAPAYLAQSISAAIAAGTPQTARWGAWLKRYGALAASLAIAMVAAALLAKHPTSTDGTSRMNCTPTCDLALEEDQPGRATTFEEAEKKLAEAEAADEAHGITQKGAVYGGAARPQEPARGTDVAKAPALAEAADPPVYDLVIEADSPRQCLDDLAKFLRGRGVNIVGKISSQRSVLFADLTRRRPGGEAGKPRSATAQRRTGIIDQIIQSGKFQLARHRARPTASLERAEGATPAPAGSITRERQLEARAALEPAPEATRRSMLAILVVNRPPAESPVAADAKPQTQASEEAAGRNISEPTQPGTQ